MICTDVLRMFYFSPRWLPENRFSGAFPQVSEWGGWGSNPRPADYEKHGPALRAHYLHGCHGVVPPMALTSSAANGDASLPRLDMRVGWGAPNAPNMRGRQRLGE